MIYCLHTSTKWISQDTSTTVNQNISFIYLNVFPLVFVMITCFCWHRTAIFCHLEPFLFKKFELKYCYIACSLLLSSKPSTFIYCCNFFLNFDLLFLKNYYWYIYISPYKYNLLIKCSLSVHASRADHFI